MGIGIDILPCEFITLKYFGTHYILNMQRSFIWSSDPMRVFTSQELSYLAAFSNSVMAEVARLNTQLADAAKADFISSISHELRSTYFCILPYRLDIHPPRSPEELLILHLRSQAHCTAF